MATNRTSTFDVFRGLALPDRRMTASTFPGADTSVTQQGPRAGQPKPQGDMLGTLRARGTQTAGTTVEVFTQSAGLPGQATARHRLSTWASTDWLGADLPVVSHGTDAIQWDTGSGTYQGARYPHAVRTAAGTLLAAVRHTGFALSATGNVFVYRSTDDGVTWSRVQVAVYTSTMGTGRDTYPTLVPLPDGSVLAFAWITLSSGDVQVRGWVSADDGATWSLLSRACLPAAVSYNAAAGGASGYSEFRRLRAAYNPDAGQVLLIGSLKLANTTISGMRDVFIQWASKDQGITFSEVAKTDQTATDGRGGRYQDVVWANGYFHVAWAGYDSSMAGNEAQTTYCRLASAFERITYTDHTESLPSATLRIAPAFGQTSGTYQEVTDGYLGMTVDEVGTLYIFQAVSGSAGGDTLEGVVMRSTDNGESWEWIGRSSVDSEAGTWWSANDRTTHPAHIAPVWGAGGCLLLHNFATTAGTYDESLMVTRLGGPIPTTMPDDDATSDTSVSHVSMDRTWRGYAAPDVSGWTKSTSGTPTESQPGAGYRTVCTTDSIFWHQSFTATAAQGIIVWASVDPGATASASTDECSVRLRLADAGSYEYDISIRVGTASVLIIDNNGGGTLATATVDVTASGVDMLIAFAGADVELWVRQRTMDPEARWDDHVSSGSVSDAGATANSNRISFGTLILGTVTCDWYEVSYAPGAYTGDHLIGFANPTDLRGRTIGGEWVYLQDGVEVLLEGGPARVGDLWYIATEYEAPVTLLSPFESATPRERWKATGETQQDITLDMDATLTTAGRMPTDLLAVGIYGANIRTGELFYQNAAGSYVSLGTFDFADGYQVNYTRSGNVVVPLNSSGDTPFLLENMCEGWTADLGTGKLRRVLCSSGGIWSTAGGRRASVTLEGCDGTEPATGSMYLYPPNAVLLVQLFDAGVRAVKLTLDAQATVDGHIKAGTVLIGSAYLFGEPYSRERNITHEAGVSESASEDGVYRAVETAPVRRTVEFAWTEGVYLKPSQESGADPDYFDGSSHGSAVAVGNIGVTPLQVMGIYRYLHGRLRPCVYLPRVVKFPALTTPLRVLNHPDDHMLCTITSAARFESALGNENAAEFARTGQVVLRERT